MKKVLISLDYNPTSQKVAEMGFDLAKSMGAEVTLLHVVFDPVYYASLDYSPIMGFSGFLNEEPLRVRRYSPPNFNWCLPCIMERSSLY